MITDEQIENAVKVGAYKPAERAAYEHGLKWGMKRAALAIRATAEATPETPEGRLAKACCEGLADALEGASK